MAIQLSDEHRQYIKSQLAAKMPDAKYYIFGSRVKGTAKSSSDLDTVIVSQQTIPLHLLSDIKEIFVESNLPFKVDLVDWYRINEEFRKKIQNEWVEL